MNANSTQVGGAHYASPYQHWDLAADAHMGYFEGQVTKYVTRWRAKNGMQDLRKAAHFLQKLREVAEEGQACPVQTHSRRIGVHAPPSAMLRDKFASANLVDEHDMKVINAVLLWMSSADQSYLALAASGLDLIVAAAEETELKRNQSPV